MILLGFIQVNFLKSVCLSQALRYKGRDLVSVLLLSLFASSCTDSASVTVNKETANLPAAVKTFSAPAPQAKSISFCPFRSLYQLKLALCWVIQLKGDIYHTGCGLSQRKKRLGSRKYQNLEWSGAQ